MGIRNTSSIKLAKGRGIAVPATIQTTADGFFPENVLEDFLAIGREESFQRGTELQSRGSGWGRALGQELRRGQIRNLYQLMKYLSETLDYNVGLGTIQKGDKRVENRLEPNAITAGNTLSFSLHQQTYDKQGRSIAKRQQGVFMVRENRVMFSGEVPAELGAFLMGRIMLLADQGLLG